MKFFVITLFVTIAYADRLENTYLPPGNSHTAGGNGNFLSVPFVQGGKAVFKGSTSGFPKFTGTTSFSGSSPTFNRHSTVTYNSHSAPIPILRFDNQNNGDGSYQFQYETQNQINHQESGHLNNDNEEVHGSYSYISPEGHHISLNYVADENGFQPSGDHLPTPPPIPEEILKSLELTARLGDSDDDGQYRPSQHESGNYHQNSFGRQSAQGSLFSGPSRQYLAPKNNYNNNGGYRY